MPGRFTLRAPISVLIEHFQLGPEAARQLPPIEPRYNIAPSQDIFVIRAEPKDGEREGRCCVGA
jgi:putative SOS response-associated peptidase YedK